jgi:flagellar hook protein FlgE
VFGTRATGTATLGTTTATTTTITTGTNDKFQLTIDGGAAITVTIPPAGYTGGTTGTLLPAVQAAINTALAAQVPPVKTPVTVNLDAAGHMVLSGSGVVQATDLAVGPVTGATTLFGAASFTTALSATSVAGLDNFNPTNPSSYTSTTSQTVFDNSGNKHTVTMYFAKTSEPNVWQMYSAIDGQPPGPSGSSFVATPMVFLPSGILQNPTALKQTLTNAAGTVNLALDLSKSTQNTLNFGVNAISQDGYAAGTLSGVSIDSNGIITGRFTNGQSQPMGQLALVNFTNPNGLRSLGNNQWGDSPQAGRQSSSAPSTSSLGSVQAGAVEESNVDLTKELVNMITAQRAYQANAQSIKTEDQIMQTLVSLR